MNPIPPDLLVQLDEVCQRIMSVPGVSAKDKRDAIREYAILEGSRDMREILSWFYDTDWPN